MKRKAFTLVELPVVRKCETKGFTLVELLVVVAILALLLTIIAPSFSSAVAMGRAAICQNNLHKLGQAFSLSSTDRAQRGSGQIIGSGSRTAYPEPEAWPGIPRDAVSEDEIYKCPEDETVAAEDAGSLDVLEYRSEYGQWAMDVVGEGPCYKSRRGVSSQGGPFTEFIMQDDIGTGGQYAAMAFNGWIDTDGGCRVYDSGVIHVWYNIQLESAGSVPDWSGSYGGYPTGINTCGNMNDILYRGGGAFGGDPMLQPHKGEDWQLPDWQAQTNYAINSYAYKYPFGSGIIVLVDYKEETIVDLDTPLESEILLMNSARHLRKVNYLMADGSVKTATPEVISPVTHLKMWTP